MLCLFSWTWKSWFLDMKLLQFDNTKNPYCPKPYPPSQIVHPKPMNASQVIHLIPPPPWDFNPSFKKKKKPQWLLVSPFSPTLPCPLVFEFCACLCNVLAAEERERERVEEKKLKWILEPFFLLLNFNFFMKLLSCDVIVFLSIKPSEWWPKGQFGHFSKYWGF